MTKGLILSTMLVLLGLGVITGCGEPDAFKDSLTFGTGITGTGFTLVGESTTFSLATLGGKPLWFRLESAADLDGRFVRLYTDGITNKDFTDVQKTGHITLSNYPVTNAGTYQVKGYYVQTIIDIGKETLVAGNTITVTP
jgi:hypothetical protein